MNALRSAPLSACALASLLQAFIFACCGLVDFGAAGAAFSIAGLAAGAMAASAATAEKVAVANVAAISTDNSWFIMSSNFSRLITYMTLLVSLPITFAVLVRLTLFGAGGGTRTPTPFLAPDFESGTSTSSITPAKGNADLIAEAALAALQQSSKSSCTKRTLRFFALLRLAIISLSD